ncbi:Hypothetical protein PHPALM_1782 [Phytophthora palmivora]|uniref:ABC Superfamily n=1 Tax=Phytophthora palmivora TaxID=4796 RepID=A0A2P4YRH2_9STRA|nr:Hypothetical protein PHPALM_1782 [Phytophthora palmivora]
MPRKDNSKGAAGPPKSKTARSKTPKAKSKDKAASRKPAAAATQGWSPRRSRSRSLSPDDMLNPRFAYRNHSPGEESPVFDISMITGSESAGGTTGSTKDPTPSQDAPSQDAPIGDSESSEAKAASTNSPAKSLSLDEAPGSPTSEPPITKGFRSLFDSGSDEDEGEGAVTEPQEISNDLDEQQERFQAAQLQGASEVTSSAPSTPVYPRGYYPPDAGPGSSMSLGHLKALVV